MRAAATTALQGLHGHIAVLGQSVWDVDGENEIAITPDNTANELCDWLLEEIYSQWQAIHATAQANANGH